LYSNFRRTNQHAFFFSQWKNLLTAIHTS
jgi:hypothetical protein